MGYIARSRGKIRAGALVVWGGFGDDGVPWVRETVSGAEFTSAVSNLEGGVAETSADDGEPVDVATSGEFTTILSGN